MAFERILVAIDGSVRDGTALSTALRAANPSASIRLVHVRGWLPPPPPSKDDPSLVPADTNVFTETREWATDLVEAALCHLRSWGATAEGMVVEVPRFMTGAAIATAAEEWHLRTFMAAN